jgi:hypothetical protein
MSKKILPLVAMKIDPKKGSFVSAISIVDRPAIGSNFIAFSQDEPTKIMFSEEKQELIGAAMIPGLPMYRNTPGVGEYMSVFDADTIRQIAQVFAEKGFFNNMNIQHSSVPAGAFVFQSYIVDTAKGMPAPVGIDAPDGSWIVGVKVNDPTTWLSIKEGKSNGFSVEGLFDLFDTDMSVALLMNADEIKLAQEFDDALQAMPKGCLMFFPNIDLAQWELQARITIPGANELELQPHVTIVYGFPDAPENPQQIKDFLTEALNVYPLDLMLGSISKFTGQDMDVVKIEICDCNGALSAINTILSDMFGVVSDYGQYSPHMTIGYITPDPSLLFSSEGACSWSFGINSLNKGKIVYSDANKNITELLTIK